MKEVDTLGRKIRWHEWSITRGFDERHRTMVIHFFDLDRNSKKLI